MLMMLAGLRLVVKRGAADADDARWPGLVVVLLVKRGAVNAQNAHWLGAECGAADADDARWLGACGGS